MTCAQLEKNLREAFAAEAEAETPDDNALAHARVWAAIDGMTAPPADA
jgi:NAD-dependent oxidoreductase involved in siderophore biosynthesis